MNSAKIFEKLTLPNGSVIPNRIAKAAMEENMADADHAPSPELMRLYKFWADGEVGLIITGNVMVDARAMTGPGGVLLEDDRHLDRFKRWAEIGRSKGGQIWLQINHPGRQMQANLGQKTFAPSAVALDLGKMSSRFAVPEAMTEDAIADVIRRFARAAQLGEQAGFTGVEVHAATSGAGRIVDASGMPYLMGPFRLDGSVNVMAPVAMWQHLAPGTYTLTIAGKTPFPFAVAEGQITRINLP